jgi:HD-like signal output (HDOD) protein/prolyl-tRNA editing enzyme YbaK/EbsC (Cys-tRNA(Pro) deacylase)
VTVPASIETLLKKHNVSYSLATLLPSATSAQATNVRQIMQNLQEQTANAHLLQSANKEKLLAITPNHSIVDLQAIKNTLGEAYSPVTGDALKTFVNGLGLESMAVMPKLGNLPTIVDPLLLKTETLLLNVGVDNQLIELDGQSFQKLLKSTIVSSISVPLSTINTAIPSEMDEKYINQSVQQFTELRIKQRLEETLELPSLPAIAQKIIKLRVDPNADVSDLCSIIELDPSLSAQVVSWASSPYYSAPGSIKSIHDAIVRVLGFDMVLSLALGLALGNTLKLPKYQPEGCVSYWEQAVYVATCTEAIISCMPRECRPGYGCSYLSGLLHNFGYLITAEVFSGHFSTICEHTDANPHRSPLDIEQHIIGVTRDQLASWLMRYWHMPEEVCVALRQQNNPDYDGEHSEYASLLYLTKKLLNERGIRTGVSSEPIPDALFTRFKVNREDANEAIDIMLESSELLDSMAQQMRG